MSASRKNIDFDWVIMEYKSGVSVPTIANILCASQRLVYNILEENNVKMIGQENRKGKKIDKSICEKMSATRISRHYKMSDKQKKIISEANSCNFDGMNGYGHTKPRSDGYISCYVPRHPYCHKDKYAMLHTVIMERSIGRYLYRDEVVHHVNGVRDDNRIENLQLMKTHDHQSMHMKKRYEERRRLLSTR